MLSGLKEDNAEENKTRKKVYTVTQKKIKQEKIFLSAISMYQLSHDHALNL